MRALIIALVLALASLAGVGWVYKAQVERAAALTTQLEILTEAQKQAVARARKDRKVLVARQATIASQARILAGQEQVLQNALQRDNDWNNTNVPPDVQDALAGASSPVPEPVPDGLRDQ